MQVAFIISAPREMTLTAGLVEISPGFREPEDDPPCMKVGRARGGELHLSGPLIAGPDLLGSTISVNWYLPGEEEAEAARPVDLEGAAVLLNIMERRPAEPGWRWRYLLESRRPSLETRFYEGGFQPPLKASDLTFHLFHLINFNYDGFILGGLDYAHRPASYIESEWSQPTLESAGFLEDGSC